MSAIKKAFVAGFPIHHSLSPHIHKFWLETYEINGSYEAIAVAPPDFPAFIASLKQQGFVGGNITLPHKEQAFKLAHFCDESARAIGAANSLWFEKDCLWASNSDAYGFARNLDDFAPDWRAGQTALVLGAGGAARAIIFALKQQGFDRIWLANRTRERAEQLAAHFGPAIKVLDWQEMDKQVASADLIINTTSAGLTGKLEHRNEDLTHAYFALNFARAPKQAIVTDIIYTPLETPFLQAAQNQGLKTVDGLGMLLHQAVFGFERWFGVQPTVSEHLRNRVLARLQQASNRGEK